MADAVSYIPFQRVKDWKVGDRITVDGNPGKIRDIIEFENPSGSGGNNCLYRCSVRQ